MADTKEELEIERRWILTNGSPDLSGAKHVKQEITQFYLLNDKGHAERVRQSVDLDSKETTYSHTIKRPGPKGGSWEWEEEVSPDKFAELLKRIDSNRQAIIKVRRSFKLGKLKYEVDSFLHPVSFCILEVEVPSLKTKVKIPGFLGDTIEVTKESRLSGYKISARPNSATKKVDSLIAAHLDEKKKKKD
jgi:CYTH domain-containing protein